MLIFLTEEIVAINMFLCELTMRIFLAHFVRGIFNKKSSNSLYRLFTCKLPSTFKGAIFKDMCNNNNIQRLVNRRLSFFRSYVGIEVFYGLPLHWIILLSFPLSVCSLYRFVLRVNNQGHPTKTLKQNTSNAALSCVSIV